MTVSTTLWTLRSYTIQLMNETSNNNTYSWSDRDVVKINDVIKRVCSWYIKSLLNPNESFKCLDMPFLRDRQFLQYKDPIAITSAIAVWDTEINLDTTNLDDTGAIYAQGIVISYTGKTATSITWCTGVIASFESWTYFTKVFQTNANFDQAYRLFHMYNSTETEVFEVKREDERYQREKIKSFTIIYDETSGNNFIMLRGFDNDDRFILKYYKLVDNLSIDSDICVIPDEYAQSVVCPIVAGEMLMESQSEDWEFMNKLTIWYGRLQEMYHKYTQQQKDMDKMVKQKPYNYSSISTFWGTDSKYTRSWFTIY